MNTNYSYKKRILSFILTFAITVSLCSVVSAAPVKKSNFKATVTINAGEYTSLEPFVEHILMPDSEHSDYSSCSFEILNSSTSNNKISAFYKNGKYYCDNQKSNIIKGIKKGTANYKIVGIFNEENEENTIDSEVFIINLKVNVKSTKALNGDSKKLALKIVKKASKKSKFAFVDLDYDGVKDLVCGGNLYYYKKAYEFEGDKYPSQLVKQKTENKLKVKKVYKNEKILATIIEGTEPKLNYCTGEAIMIETKAERNYINFSLPNYHLLKLSKSGIKHFNNNGSYIDYRNPGYVVLKKVFSNISKSFLKNKKEVKLYKNTKSNRSKYIK